MESVLDFPSIGEIFALPILEPKLSVLCWRLNILLNASDKPKLKLIV